MFGWGLYFSDLKSIAKHYSEMVDDDTWLNLKAKVKKQYQLDDAGEYYLNSVGLVLTGSQSLNETRKRFNERLANPRDGMGEHGLEVASNALRALDDFESGKLSFKKPRNLYKVTLHKGKQPGEYEWFNWYGPIPMEQSIRILKQAEKENLKGLENVSPGGIFTFTRKGLKDSDDDVQIYGNQLYSRLSESLRSQSRIEADLYHESLRDQYDLGQKEHLLEKLTTSEREKMDAVNDKAAMSGDHLASLFLLRAGIDGIRYPAGTLSSGQQFSQDDRKSLASQVFKQDANLPNLIQSIMSEDNDFKTINGLLIRAFGKTKTANMMKDAGVKPGTVFNYVVFDENAVTIDEHTRYRVRQQSEDADHEKSWVASTMLSLKEFGKAFKNPKAGFQEGKVDTTVLSRMISTPSHYYKTVPALQRMFDGAMRYPDNKQAYINAITKSKVHGDFFTTRLDQLQKEQPEEYAGLKDYLVNRDIDQIGFKVKADKSGKFFSVIDPKGQTVSRTATEMSAWNLAVKEEFERYLKAGHSEQAGQALLGFRSIMHNGFNILYKNIRETIAHLESLGMALPEVAVWSGGEKVTVDLKLALQMMGDLRGYYFPRQRPSGRFMVIGETKSGERFMDFRDLKSTAQSLVNKLTLKGYKAYYKKSPALPEDVFEMARSTVAIQAEINAALQRIGTKGGVTLEDFGLKRVKTITDTMKASFTEQEISEFESDFLITGPWNKDMTPVFKAMGGKWFRQERIWHFFNPPNDFEQRLVKALMNKISIVDRQMATLFAKSLTEQAANVIKARGHRVHMIQRATAKGSDVWKGYETDPAIASANYAKGLSSGESKRIMAGELVGAMTGTDYTWDQYKRDMKNQDAKPDYKDYSKIVEERRIDPAEQKNAFRDGKVYMEDLLRNQEWIDRFIGGVKGVAVFKYLAGRVSAPIVNLTAMVTSVPASMNGFADIPVTATAPLLMTAAKHYTNYKLGRKTDIPSDALPALDELTEKAWDKSQYNQEAFAVLEGKLKGTWRKVLEYGMFAFGVSEQLNRGATILGTYMGIKARGGEFSHRKAIDLARHVSDQAHGTYGKVNYPFMARGSNPAAQLIKSFYVFRTFAHNYLLTMKDLWGHNWKPEHAKAFSYMLISPAQAWGAMIRRRSFIIGWALSWGITRRIWRALVCLVCPVFPSKARCR
jgi:hypothetical protein